MTSGWQGSPYFRRYGRELVSKPSISFKKSWGATTVEQLEGQRNPSNYPHSGFSAAERSYVEEYPTHPPERNYVAAYGNDTMSREKPEALQSKRHLST